MENVLVVAPASQLMGEHGNNRSRFRYLCEYLCNAGYEVTEAVSSFRDYDKYQRDVTKNYDDGYKVKLIKEPGYIKNISIQRIISQNIFALKLQKWLKSQTFDLVYCSVPSPETAYVAAKYCQKKGIPFVIDVQDLWPEAMRMAIPVYWIADIVLFPYKCLSNYVYGSADGIIACSDTYLQRALQNNKKSLICQTVFIGIDLEEYDKNVKLNRNLYSKNDTEIWITYIGMLGRSYDLDTLICASDNLFNEGYPEIRVKIFGTGEKEESLRYLAKTKSVPVDFMGWVKHNEMVVCLSKSDILVNAIKKDGPQSITNKIGDYVSAGIPIINGSPNAEFRGYVEKYNLGVNYTPENVESMAKAIRTILSKSREERLEMGGNARRFSEKYFDRGKTYPLIIDLISQLLK